MDFSSGKMIALLGAMIGFSISIGYTIMRNRELNDEVTRQTRSILKTTGKFVNYYRGVIDYIASENSEDDSEDARKKYDRMWESALQKH